MYYKHTLLLVLATKIFGIASISVSNERNIDCTVVAPLFQRLAAFSDDIEIARFYDYNDSVSRCSKCSIQSLNRTSIRQQKVCGE